MHALSFPYSLDGRISWYPSDVRGYGSSNSYLISEDNCSLLIDTGLTVHRAAMLHEVGSLTGERRVLDIMVLRQGEFDSVCNLIPLVRAFGVMDLHGQFDDVLGWSDFDVDEDAVSLGPPAAMPRTHAVARKGTVSVGGVARLKTYQPSLRLLNTFWVYDDVSRCLFTSDSFSYLYQADPDGPWLVTADRDATDYESVRHHMIETRYWWVPGADSRKLRSDLAAVFERFEVETICPAWGSVLHGSDVVQRHYQMVDDVLRREGRC